MKIVFRTDASLQIGTGHVMRCLTLADALKVHGAQCHFICREHPGNFIEQVRLRGFEISILPGSYDEIVTTEPKDVGQANYAAWLGVDWATDAAQTKVGAGETVADWLIVDHYALDVRWEQALRPTCRKLMVIDDLADRPHDCDLLLDQNLGRNTCDYKDFVPEDGAVLTGPSYALLRPEFAAMRDYSLGRREIPQLKHLLIAVGGVDQADATGRILETLKGCSLPMGLRITVVMGPHAPWLERIQLLAIQISQLAEVKVNVSNMAQLMAESDIAIGAAGSTSWERCCLGLPAVIVVLADNQQSISNALQAVGAARSFSLTADAQAIRNLINNVFNDADALVKMSLSAAKITDGLGAVRVIAQMLEMK